MSDQIERLRQNVRKLDPDGAAGFEGLIAAVLTDLTGRTFAIASAGSQQGRDGQSTLDQGAIVFEAKRYDESLPKGQIESKLFEIGAYSSGTTELFVIGATCPISSQHINVFQEGARRLSIGLLVVAWPDNKLPELPTLLAMTPDVTARFISKHASVDESELIAQLSAVSADTQFNARKDEILRLLRQPSIAPAYALPDNIAWLARAFSDKGHARAVFGQALSPHDPSIACRLERKSLTTTIGDSVFSKPSDSVTAILGAEGNGKSWIFAQTWKIQTSPPLTLVIVPEDIVTSPSPESCQTLLVSKLLEQTDDFSTNEARERWLRHFERWKARPPNTNLPRLVVFIDGVNQRATLDWSRFLDAMSSVVAALRGSLVFSCRTHFFNDHLKTRMFSRLKTIDVPEWSNAELEELLNIRGTAISSLDEAIIRTLRNPRIFGVAASLFGNAEIQSFGELSVSRLLFEHIRGSAVDGSTITVNQFRGQICSHAEDILRRLGERDIDGFNEFEIATDRHFVEQLNIVSAGYFFEVAEENPDKYILREQCLPLALGLALVRRAKEALRKNKDVSGALSKILDPISALDMTGDVLMGGILAAALGNASDAVTAPLVIALVRLQNLDFSRYAEFRGLFARQPLPFLVALEVTTLSENISPNDFWLTNAVSELRDTVPFEAELQAAIHRWLSMYSTSPERAVLLPKTAEHVAMRENKLIERQSELASSIAALCREEKDLMNGMFKEDRGDYSRLSLHAFHFLAARPLAHFALSLRNWCFAAALNGGTRYCHEEFADLLHFNVVDWGETRRALHSVAAALRARDASKIGQWALVYLLQATGDSDDARQSKLIRDELTKDRASWNGWRRIESYCATDPCDPASEEPDNIEKTANAYQNINPAEVCRYRNRTRDDLLFEEARTGLVRFRPKSVVHVMQALANQAVSRSDQEFGRAVFTLENHTLCLDRVVTPYVQKAKEIAQCILDAGKDAHQEGWAIAQCALAVAFPHMTGDEQFDALLAHPDDRSILLNLCYLFQPINARKLEERLEQSVQEARPVAQFRILGFAEFSGTKLTERSKQIVVNLISSSNDHVRLSALSLVKATGDRALLAGLVNSGWTARTLDVVSHNVEAFSGSGALALAAELGLISLEDCLDRITISGYEVFGTSLSDNAIKSVVERLKVAVNKALTFVVTANLPEISQTFESRHWPVFLEVSDKRSVSEPVSARFEQLAQSEDAWHERQRHNQEALERFGRELSVAGAQLIMESVTDELIERVDQTSPGTIDDWCALFIDLDSKSFSNIHNIAALVAQVVSKRNPAAACTLLNRLNPDVPHVRVTYGLEEVALDALVAWKAAGIEQIARVCFARLDRCSNDHELAMEVLAALRAGREGLLCEYVLDRRQRIEPAFRARASMVAGLSPNQGWAVETIEMLREEYGFLHHAYQAAKYAMERHQWSCYWGEQVQSADNSLDLWRYSVLLSRIVDGRTKWSAIEGNGPSALLKRFGPTLSAPYESRIGKWKNKRVKKLFGMDVPDKVFLRRTSPNISSDEQSYSTSSRILE